MAIDLWLGPFIRCMRRYQALRIGRLIGFDDLDVDRFRSTIRLIDSTTLAGRFMCQGDSAVTNFVVRSNASCPASVSRLNWYSCGAGGL